MTKATGRTLLMLLVIAALVAVASPAAGAQDEARTVVFQVPLSGPDPEGQGTAVLRLSPAEGTVCYVIVVRGIGEPTEPAPGLGNAHIHGPLPSTGIAVHLETEFMQAGASDVFLARGCVNVDAATLEAILANPELFYVNVHTVEFPGGAIQGTLA
ncbi:MAG: CHRD domain-containing protein [Actinomycetota bacterium]|nr:CHRD domain-containing protein [Actinomycetota bacterium]